MISLEVQISIGKSCPGLQPHFEKETTVKTRGLLAWHRPATAEGRRALVLPRPRPASIPATPAPRARAAACLCTDPGRDELWPGGCRSHRAPGCVPRQQKEQPWDCRARGIWGLGRGGDAFCCRCREGFV